jgi:YfiH family protein
MVQKMTLPTPDPAFHWTTEAWGHALRCTALESIAQHAFTTRQLKLRAGGLPANVAGWTQALASINAGPEQLIRVRQVHAATVRVLREGETGAADVAALPDGDAIVSNARGYVLSVQVADCVPMLMADGRTGAIAAVHAGWRGTCAGVARGAVDAMTREFGTRAPDLTIAIGPSIGPCCYEIDAPVVEAFRRAGASDAQRANWFSHTESGSLRLDLWAANRDQLVSAGADPARIHTARLCTQTHREIFESYRVDGAAAGRLLALIVRH